MHQVLEHVDEPERALAECRRVLRPGGRLVVVGPNLDSPAVAARALLVGLVRGPRRRTPGMPRHPYGNVPREWIAALARTLSRRPRFERREADTHPPFHADNDAAWFCNPADLRAWGREAGMRPVRWWSDRPGARAWWPFAAGTWVVLERGS
jgi:SAM-dependent methyltransferase